MLNFSPAFCGSSLPSARKREKGSPSSTAIRPRYRSVMSGVNMSKPAGTGVWVVNTFAPTVALAAAVRKSEPFAFMNCRMRSRVRNAAWPSFRWQTVGRIPSASSARIPPMPRIISCRKRISSSPP